MSLAWDLRHTSGCLSFIILSQWLQRKSDCFSWKRNFLSDVVVVVVVVVVAVVAVVLVLCARTHSHRFRVRIVHIEDDGGGLQC